MSKKMKKEVTQHLNQSGKPNDPVMHPSHYGGKDNPYEVIKVMEAWLTPEEFIGAMKFNIHKYDARHRQKGGLEDLKKAQFYQNYLVDFMERNLDYFLTKGYRK